MTVNEIVDALWQPSHGEMPQLHPDALEALMIAAKRCCLNDRGLWVSLKPADVFQPWLLEQMKAAMERESKAALLPPGRNPLGWVTK
jgi:hypothetical protein